MATCFKDLATGFPSGTILAQRYRVVGVIGRGKGTSVLLCRDKERGAQRVAVKLLTGEERNTQAGRSDFIREFLLGQQINHPFILEYLETVRDDRACAFTTEYIPGGTMANLIARHSQFDMRESLRLLDDCLTGLQVLHDHHIVHHDLKPSNILLTHRRQIKICDFGISRFNGQTFDGEESNRRGTPYYMAPEYLTDGIASVRSDVFSLGVIAYELLCGQVPFKGDSVLETIDLRFRHRPPAPHTIRADCSLRVSRTVMKALSLEPNDRFQSAEEMRAAFSENWTKKLLGLLKPNSHKKDGKKSIAEIIAA